MVGNPFEVDAGAVLGVEDGPGAGVQVDNYQDIQVPNEQELPELEDDKELIIDINNEDDGTGLTGLSLTTLLFIVNVTLLIVVIMVTECRRNKLARPDTSMVVRKYTQRVAATNFFFAAIVFSAVVWLEVIQEGEDVPIKKQCYPATDQARIALAVICFSMVISLLRLLAYGYAYSQLLKSADKNKDSKHFKAFDPAESDAFMHPIKKYQWAALAVFVILFVITFEYTPAPLPNMMNFSVCTVKELVDTTSKVLFCSVMLCGMHVAIIVSEAIFGEKIQFGLHMMQHLLQSEYTLSALALNGSGWFLLLCVMWFIGNSAMQCLFITILFVTTESLWAAVMCIATPNSKVIALV